MTSTRVRSGALVVAVFAAGVAAGIGYARQQNRSADVSESDVHHMVAHLADELTLDSAQRAKVEAILARHQSSVDSIWQVMHPHLRQTLDSALQEIGGVLRPDQVEKYRRLVESRHSGASHDSASRTTPARTHRGLP